MNGAVTSPVPPGHLPHPNKPLLSYPPKANQATLRSTIHRIPAQRETKVLKPLDRFSLGRLRIIVPSQ